MTPQPAHPYLCNARPCIVTSLKLCSSNKQQSRAAEQYRGFAEQIVFRVLVSPCPPHIQHSTAGVPFCITSRPFPHSPFLCLETRAHTWVLPPGWAARCDLAIAPSQPGAPQLPAPPHRTSTSSHSSAPHHQEPSRGPIVPHRLSDQPCKHAPSRKPSTSSVAG